MAQILVRGLEDAVKDALQRRARQNGHSMEEEARDILRAAMRPDIAPGYGLGTRIAQRFAATALDEPLEPLNRQEARPAQFE